MARYTAELTRLWEANQLLGRRYTEAAEVTVTPEQLEQLKALGYVQ